MATRDEILGALVGRYAAASREEKGRLITERAARAGDGARGLQLWPVIRQVLAIADDGACARWLERLDRRALPAFRAAALALTSREQADLLARVREWALAPGPDVGAEQRVQLQREWLRALEGAEPSLAPAAFEGALAVLARGESEAATLATETAARLIRRFGDRLPERRVVDAVETIGRASSSAARHNSLMGKLLGTFAAAARPLDRVDLAALRDGYAGLPSGLRPRVIELHLAAEVGGVDAVGFGELSRLATPLPLGGDGGRAPAVALVARSCGRDEIVARLVARDFDTTWTGVFAAAAGRAAADDDAALDALIAHLAGGGNAGAAMAALALVEAAGAGAATRIAERLVAMPVGALAVEAAKLTSIAEVLIALTPALAEPCGRRLARHVHAAAETGGGFGSRLSPALLLLDGAAAEPWPVPWRLAVSLSVRERVDCLNRYMKAAPPRFVRTRAAELEALLVDGCMAEARGMRCYVQLCGLRAHESEAALDQLVALARGERKAAANEAARMLVALIEQGRALPPAKLLALAGARFDGVRQSWSRALIALVDGGHPAGEDDVLAALRAVDADDVAHVIRHNVCEMVRRWAARGKRVSPAIGAALAPLTERTIATQAPTTGLIAALKAVAHDPGGELLASLRMQVRRLGLGVNLANAHNAEHEFADLLTAVARHDPGVFAELVDRLGEMAPRNVQSFVLAIRRIEGRHSDLFDAILAHASCPPGARSTILGFRGA